MLQQSIITLTYHLSEYYYWNKKIAGFKFWRYRDTHPGIHYFIKWIHSVLCVQTQFDVVSKLYWRMIMLFQWSCPAQLLLDGVVKKTKKPKQNVTASFLLLIIAKMSCLSWLMKGGQRSVFVSAWFFPERAANPPWNFFVLTYGLCLLNTVSL